jgi:hypothetical protein
VPKSAHSPQRAEEDVPIRLPPAKTRERRVQQLVSQAEALVEERIRKGTASPTEVVAVLRLGTQMEEANLERVRAQTAYLEAQRAKAESETVREEMFQRAMEAMSRYSGEG